MTSPEIAPASRGRVVWYAALAVVALLGIVAVIAAKSSSNKASDDVATAQTSKVKTGASSKALPRAVDGEADAAIGQTIPTVSGKTLDGDALTIGPDGTAKVIVFVAHWCPHCQAEIPRIVSHLRDTPMPAGVELLAVSTNVAKERGNYPPKAWLDEAGWTAPVLADSTDNAAATAFGLSSFPYFVVVDADGKVVTRTTGEISMDTFDQLVKAAGTAETPS